MQHFEKMPLAGLICLYVSCVILYIPQLVAEVKCFGIWDILAFFCPTFLGGGS